MAKKSLATDAILRDLKAFGLSFPGAHTKSPWPGHDDLAVNDKTFAYLSIPGEPFGISCKLQQSCGMALMLPFASPTEYGLGKSGWVSARFGPGDEPPVDLLKECLTESYRAQAPKRFVKQFDMDGKAPVASRKAARRISNAKGLSRKGSRASGGPLGGPGLEPPGVRGCSAPVVPESGWRRGRQEAAWSHDGLAARARRRQSGEADGSQDVCSQEGSRAGATSGTLEDTPR